MYQYLQKVNAKHDLQLSTYPELYKWSINNIDQFWQSVWDFVGIRAQGKATRVRSQFVALVSHADFVTGS